jgi:hypothetical protein
MRKLPAVALSLNRIAFGAGFVLSPSSVHSWVGKRMASRPQPQLLTRALGARDVALGVGALSALGRGDTRQARAWMLGHLLADGTDLAATIAARRSLPRRSFLFASTVAGISTATAAWSAITLARRDEQAGTRSGDGHDSAAATAMTETDARVDAETAAAASEAGAIGGPAVDDDIDPAQRPVIEAGGGEAEGFEQAESELIERAEHGEPGYPGAAAFAEQREDARSGAAYGDADQVDSTEKISDER